MWHMTCMLGLGLLKSSSGESTCQQDGSNVHVLAHINTTLGHDTWLSGLRLTKPPRNLGSHLGHVMSGWNDLKRQWHVSNI